MPSKDNELSRLVQRWNGGDESALDRLVALLYKDLRRIAHAHLQGERPDHTLSTTALVHEAYVEMAGRTGPVWRGRAQFFALVSRVMRHVLIDYARRRNAAKRGGDIVRVSLDDVPVTAATGPVDLLALDEALDRLASRDERLARIVECRFFGGMPESEIADALGISERTVERDWKRARAYLYTLLGMAPADPPEPA